VQPYGRRRNETATIAFALVQQPLCLENQRVCERKVIRDVDAIVVLTLVENEWMGISGAFSCLVLGCGRTESEPDLCARCRCPSDGERCAFTVLAARTILVRLAAMCGQLLRVA
jgi:hypothetical protein